MKKSWQYERDGWGNVVEWPPWDQGGWRLVRHGLVSMFHNQKRLNRSEIQELFAPHHVRLILHGRFWRWLARKGLL